MYPTTFSYILTPLPHTYIFHSCLTTTSYGFQILFHALQHMECQRVGDNALWLITIVTAVQREATGGNGRQRANSKETAKTRRNTTGGNGRQRETTGDNAGQRVRARGEPLSQREATGGNGRQRANSKETAKTRRNTTGGHGRPREATGGNAGATGSGPNGATHSALQKL